MASPSSAVIIPAASIVVGVIRGIVRDALRSSSFIALCALFGALRCISCCIITGVMEAGPLLLLLVEMSIDILITIVLWGNADPERALIGLAASSKVSGCLRLSSRTYNIG